MKLAGSVVRVGALLALLAPCVSADVVQFDVSALLNADVVVNNGSGTLDPTQEPIDLGFTSAGNFAFPTEDVAVELAAVGQTPDGLPDDGFFPADSFHPDVQLSWDNEDDGINVRRSAAAVDSFTIDVPLRAYGEIHLYATSGDGSTDITVTLNYADSSTEVSDVVVPDWFDDPPITPEQYQVIDGRDRLNPGSGLGVPFAYEDSDTAAIFGFRFDPDPAKPLSSIGVERTDSTGVLNFFGATGQDLVASATRVYESSDPSAIVEPSNVVGTTSTSPYVHDPASGSPLFYQVDDGAGSPPEIWLTRNPVQELLLIHY